MGNYRRGIIEVDDPEYVLDSPGVSDDEGGEEGEVRTVDSSDDV